MTKTQTPPMILIIFQSKNSIIGTTKKSSVRRDCGNRFLRLECNSTELMPRRKPD